MNPFDNPCVAGDGFDVSEGQTARTTPCESFFERNGKGVVSMSLAGLRELLWSEYGGRHDG